MAERHWDAEAREWINVDALTETIRHAGQRTGEDVTWALCRLVEVLLERVAALEAKDGRDEDYQREQNERH